MKRRHGVFLAWFNLTHDHVRFVLFSAGIGFAVVLMFIQFGFRNALLDSNVLLLERLNGDIVLVSRRYTTLATREAFSRRRLIQAAAVSGVRAVYPVYVEYGLSVLRNANPEVAARSPSHSIRVVGIDPDAGLLDFPELDPQPGAPGSLVAELKRPGQALADRACKPTYGPLTVSTETELAGRRIRIVGHFDLGTDFGAEGTLLVSADTFADWLRRPYYPGGALDEVELGLVRLDEGADRPQVQRDLTAVLGAGDVDVLTKEELMAREKQFWLDNTPIGFAFGFGMIMGFVVGMVICYQILSSDVADHLAEYATLRAIGYPGRYLSRVVLQEALVLALAGFLPGLVLSWLLYQTLHSLTGLPMRLTLDRLAFIFALTIGMCAASGWIAVRKAREADPAEVF
jgi:putative ABC transport system permease protein